MLASVNHRGWGGNTVRVSDVVALSFVGAEEEDFVLNNRAPRTAAKLFQRSGSLGSRSDIEVVPRVHHAVAAETQTPCRAEVGAGLQSNIDDRSRLPSVFRRRIFLNVELLDRVDGQNGCRVAGDACAIDDALSGKGLTVKQAFYEVGVVFGAQAIGAGGGESAAGITHHPGAKLQQILVIAAIQRKIIDFLIAQRSAQSRGGGVQQGNFFLNDDSLSDLSRLQGEICTDIRGDFDDDARSLDGL